MKVEENSILVEGQKIGSIIMSPSKSWRFKRKDEAAQCEALCVPLSCNVYSSDNNTHKVN